MALNKPLLFPVVHWSGAPCHAIRTVTLLPRSGTVITGADTGELVRWKVSCDPSELKRADTCDTELKTPSILPEMLMSREGCTETCAMCSVGDEWVICATVEGFLILWSRHGELLASNLCLPFAASKLLAFTHQKEWYVACVSAGSHEVYILKIKTMSVNVIISHLFPVQSACVSAETDDNEALLFTISPSKVVYQWSYGQAMNNALVLINLRNKLMDSMILAERNIQNTIFKHCFISSQLVDWLLLQGYADMRVAAVELCHVLLLSGHIKSVQNHKKFLDGHFYYQLQVPQEQNATTTTTTINSTSVSTAVSPNTSTVTSPQAESKTPATEDAAGASESVSRQHNNDGEQVNQVTLWYKPTSIRRLPTNVASLSDVVDFSVISEGRFLYLTCTHRWYIMSLTCQLLAYGDPVSLPNDKIQEQAQMYYNVCKTSNQYISKQVKSFTEQEKTHTKKVTSVSCIRHKPEMLKCSILVDSNASSYYSWHGIRVISETKDSTEFVLWAESGTLFVVRVVGLSHDIIITDSNKYDMEVVWLLSDVKGTHEVLKQIDPLTNIIQVRRILSRNMLGKKKNVKRLRYRKASSKRSTQLQFDEERPDGDLDLGKEFGNDKIVGVRMLGHLMIVIYNSGSMYSLLLHHGSQQETDVGMISSIKDGFPTDNPNKPYVTCSVLTKTEYDLKVIKGYNNGDMTMHSSISSDIISIRSPHKLEVSQLKIISWTDKKMKRETPSTANMKNQNHLYIVSVSSFTCCISRLSDLSIFHIFDNHYSPIKSIVWSLDPFDLTIDRNYSVPHDKIQSLSSPERVSVVNNLLVLVCEDNCARCYSLSTRQLYVSLRGHNAPIHEVYCTPDCELLDVIVTETKDELYMFELSTGSLLRRVSVKEAGSLRNQLGLFSMKTQTGLAMKRRYIKRILKKNNHTMATDPKLSKLKKQQKQLESTTNTKKPIIIELKDTNFNNTDINNMNDHTRTLPKSLKVVPELSPSLNLGVFVINIGELLHELTDIKYATNNVPDGQIDMLGRLLSTLFDWETEADGLDSNELINIHHTLQQCLRLGDWKPKHSLGIMSDSGQALSVMFPQFKKNKSMIRWRFSTYMSALHALSLSAVCMSLLDDADTIQKPLYNQIVAQYNVIIPDLLNGYREPDLRTLAKFALNPNEDIQSVASLLLQAVIERSCRHDHISTDEAITHEPILSIVNSWSTCFLYKISHLDDTEMLSGIDTSVTNAPVTDSELMAAMILTFVASHERHAMSLTEDSDTQSDSFAAQSVVAPYAIHMGYTLIRTITSAKLMVTDPLKIAVACSLISKGYFLWRHYLTSDPVLLFRKLHHLSLCRNPLVADAAHKALLDAGREAPKFFIRCMGKEALSANNSAQCKSGALIAIVSLVKKSPHSLAKVLPSAVQIVVRCLDPSDPGLRKNLLLSSTAALHVLIQKYPMASFHQLSQRFAVGTDDEHKNVIIIYDLRTATKWQILSGHTSRITTLSFNADGSYLVSYSAEEQPTPTVRAWNTAVSGFFSTLLGTQGRCTKIWKLDNRTSEKTRTMNNYLKTVQLIWTSRNNVKLIREDKSEYNLGLD